MLFCTHCALKQLPHETTTVHPFAPTGKNKTLLMELKGTLIDFLDQIDQHPDNYLNQLFLISGDGLTFKKILQLKKYLGNHEDSFQSFEILQPMLALWHTLWTDLSHLVEAH